MTKDEKGFLIGLFIMLILIILFIRIIAVWAVPLVEKLLLLISLAMDKAIVALQ